MIILEKKMARIGNTQDVLESILSDYQHTGESHYFDFYILPRNRTEYIDEFTSEIEVDDSIISFKITPQMIEAYKNGEITEEDLLKLFDEEMEKIK